MSCRTPTRCAHLTCKYLALHVSAQHVSANNKIWHYLSVYTNSPDPIAFIPITVSTSALHTACFANLKSTVGLTLVKTSDLRVSTPIDLSYRPFIPPPRFLCPAPLLQDPSPPPAPPAPRYAHLFPRSSGLLARLSFVGS